MVEDFQSEACLNILGSFYNIDPSLKIDDKMLKEDDQLLVLEDMDELVSKNLFDNSWFKEFKAYEANECVMPISESMLAARPGPKVRH